MCFILLFNIYIGKSEKIKSCGISLYQLYHINQNMRENTSYY